MEFAFDLDSGCRSGKPTVRCLLPAAAISLLNMRAILKYRGGGVVLAFKIIRVFNAAFSVLSS